jgi:hypothetical protein
METKPWYLSKTVWLNVLILGGAILDAVAGSPLLSGQVLDAVLAVQSGLNLVLRFITNTGLASK